MSWKLTTIGTTVNFKNVSFCRGAPKVVGPIGNCLLSLLVNPALAMHHHQLHHSAPGGAFGVYYGGGSGGKHIQLLDPLNSSIHPSTWRRPRPRQLPGSCFSASVGRKTSRRSFGCRSLIRRSCSRSHGANCSSSPLPNGRFPSNTE